MDIGNRNIILRLYWLTENIFLLDTQDRCMRNDNTSQVIPCSVWWIPKGLIIEKKPIENGRILWIIDTSEQYFCNT